MRHVQICLHAVYIHHPKHIAMWFKKIAFLLLIFGFFASKVFSQSGGNCIEGATVTTRGGATTLDICQGDGQPNIVRFKTKPAAMPFGYLITDTENFILGVSSSSIINLEGYPVGTLRVWAFSYLGGITVQPGQHITDIPFATICSGLSANFVTVNSINPDAGMVTTTEGVTDTFLCVTSATNNLLSFISSTSGGSNYGFVVTDSDNIIVGTANNGAFDFSILSPGLYRVFGVAFGSNLQAPIGSNINSTPLSSTCFGISSNFVSVLRGTADGGTITTSDGASSINFCGPQDLIPVNLSHLSSFPTPYAYVLTDTDNRVISLLPGGVFSAEGLPVGDYRIRGIAYSGTLTVQPGEDVSNTVLSSGCFDTSNNFIPVTIRDIQSGTIQVEGSVPSEFCTFDGIADLVSFSATGQSGGNFGFLITDAQAQTVLGFSSDGQVDFDFYPEVLVRVWGIVYNGTLILQPGQPVNELLESLNCAFLSENSFEFNLITPRGGIISLTDGSPSTSVCVGDGQSDLVSFSTTSVASNPYIFVVTDGSDKVLGFSNTGEFDFEGAGNGFVRVYGISYSGNLLVNIGDGLFFTLISDGCFDISDNFATVFLVRTNGGTVSLSTGGVFTNYCTNDGLADQAFFTTNTGFASNYAFVVTDESNRVILVSNTSAIDFEGTGSGLVRVWGLAYTGNLTIQPGDILDTSTLSDRCFGLSNNFVLIEKETLQAGTLEIPGGLTLFEFCGGDGLADVAIFSSTVQNQGSHVFLITDNQNTILEVVPTGTFDFESMGAGNYRIWGLSYTGILTAGLGISATSAVLSDRCYLLSANFIQVQVNSMDGGLLSLAGDGGNTLLICGGDGSADIPEINNTASNQNASYVWFITTPLNEILTVEAGLGFDLDRYPVGQYRIWGMAYEGNVLAQIGWTVGDSLMASGCYGLSRNYIEVEVSMAIGGEIGLLDGSSSVSICLDDQLDSGPVAFTTTGMASGNYVFVTTNATGEVLDIFQPDAVVFGDNYPPGDYRIWGLAYSGTLTLQPGDALVGGSLSTACYSISSNAIPLVAGVPRGGELAFDDGSERRIICPSSQANSTWSFQANFQSVLPYVYLLTDTAQQILQILDAGSFNFSLSGYPELRIVGLSFAGTLLAQPGDLIHQTALATECYQLSANFLSVIYAEPEGGFVQASNQTIFYICEEAGNQEVQFSTSAELYQSYVFVVTNAQNQILGFSQNNRVDFSAYSQDSLRVWGLSYTGDFLAVPGDTLFGTLFSSDCFDLSENFVHIFRAEAEGGIIFNPNGGSTSIEVCAGDGISNPVNFGASGQSNAGYIYVITDQNNFFIGFTNQTSFDFENAVEGVFRIYGMSYTGIFQLFPGDNLFGAVPASTGCFDFSENFIEVRTIKVDGGTVSSMGSVAPQYICIGDGVPDVVSFSSTSTATGTPFVWVFTNEHNLITGLSNNNSFDFNIAGRGITRVWGLSFTGNFLANFGDTLTSIAISDECFDLSSNFLTIIRDSPIGGDIATSEGETVVEYCQGVDDPELQIVTNTTSILAYTFVLTDSFNEIIAISESGLFDLSQLAAGTYRIWGISYAGTLNANVSNLFDIDLGSSCLEISSGFVTINVSTALQGGVLSALSGETELWFCPTDGVSDLVEVQTTSATSADQYKYLITNANGVVLLPDLFGNAIDFEGVGAGEYHLYGVAFSGDYLLQIGDNIFTSSAASQCFQFSSNFIRVQSASANGGTLATADGETTLLLNTSDGIPDSLTLVHSGSAGTAYIFVFTDLQNRVIDYSFSPNVDLEGRTEPALRIWGLSWYGPMPEDTGIPLENLVAQDNCTDLSDNAILITTLPPVLRQAPSGNIMVQAALYPNPATDMVTLEFTTPHTLESTSEFSIYDGYGKLLNVVSLGSVIGQQRIELDISRFDPGLYYIRLVVGSEMQTLRLVKTK